MIKTNKSRFRIHKLIIMKLSSCKKQALKKLLSPWLKTKNNSIKTSKQLTNQKLYHNNKRILQTLQLRVLS